MVKQQKPTLWLRSEHKPNEARTLVTPNTAKQLIEAGYSLVVEHSVARAFDDHHYADVGCEMVEEFSWQHHAPVDAIIIGLKELSASQGPFRHRHVHFAHVYKNQDGWQPFLQQFIKGEGDLYDLEYLVDENGRRIAAFGYWAGYVGAAVALLQWAKQQSGNTLGVLTPWASRDELQQQARDALSATGNTPSAMVIGAKGRCGGGAIELCEACGVDVTKWDQAETSDGGPFDEILDHQVMINCVFLNSPVSPFTTMAHLQTTNRQLSVISDVSCDPFSDANPLPIYSECTSMGNPSLRIIEGGVEGGLNGQAMLALDLISIDHLPSLLPVESSDEFATALLPYLLKLDQIESGVWQRAAIVFKQKCAQAQSGVKT